MTWGEKDGETSELWPNTICLNTEGCVWNEKGNRERFNEGNQMQVGKVREQSETGEVKQLGGEAEWLERNREGKKLRGKQV